MEPYRAGGCGVATFIHLCNLLADTAISKTCLYPSRRYAAAGAWLFIKSTCSAPHP